MDGLASLLSEKQFLCSVCHGVLVDPVTTPCGHNFCLACLGTAWDSSGVCGCPSCDRTFPSKPDLSINQTYKDLADIFRRMRVSSSASPTPELQPDDVVCDICVGTAKALRSCLVCLTSYCEVHLEPHQRVATLMLHTLTEPVKNLPGRICSKHGRLLEMFCRDEQECLCCLCVEIAHRDHDTTTVQEESEARKMQIRETEEMFQQMLETRLKKEQEIRESLELSMASAAKEQQESDHLFSTLIGFLEERRAEVEAEIREKQRATEERVGELLQLLQQDKDELQRRSTELKELEETEDHLHLVQTLPNLVMPLPCREVAEFGVQPELCVGTMRRALSTLDQAVKTQLADVMEEEMKRMKKYAVDMVFDPDTAHPNIVLSEDGKSAGHGEQLGAVADNPRRFDPVICVLGKDGFLSGRFYFQVSVGAKTYWDLGVVRESANRKGRITSTPENGFWSVRLRAGEEYRALRSPSVLLDLTEKPQLVGVFVDYEEGLVSFFNVDTHCHIYTFSNCSFSEKIFPFFSPGIRDEGKNTMPLVIIDSDQV